jgi:hypothetical protein
MHEEGLVMTRIASSRLSVLAVILATMAGAPPALAQATPPPAQADQDHRTHHPDANAPDKPATPGGMGMKGMMGDGMMCGGDMKQMMTMMRDMSAMMSAHTGMMASHVDSRIANLKTELRISDAQMPQWNRFAEALRGLGKAMEGMQGQMMPPAAAATLPARLARREEMLSAHLAAVKAVKEALDPLYASFSDEQKKIADAIGIGPMGMM